VIIGKKLVHKQHPQKLVRVTNPVQKMANLVERKGQATVDSADPAPNSTQRRKMLPTRMAVEEVAKEKTDGGGRRPGVGHQVNS
jgi:hypothetical protein